MERTFFLVSRVRLSLSERWYQKIQNTAGAYIEWFKGRDGVTMAKTIEIVTETICEGCRFPHEAITVIIEDIDRKSWGRADKPYA